MNQLRIKTHFSNHILDKAIGSLQIFGILAPKQLLKQSVFLGTLKDGILFSGRRDFQNVAAADIIWIFSDDALFFQHVVGF